MHGTLQAAKRYRQFMRRAALYTAGGTLMGLAIFGLYRWVLHCMTRQALIKRPLCIYMQRGVQEALDFVREVCMCRTYRASIASREAKRGEELGGSQDQRLQEQHLEAKGAC